MKQILEPLYLRRRLGARLCTRHEDTEEPHDDQMHFINRTALILLRDILNGNGKVNTFKIW